MSELEKELDTTEQVSSGREITVNDKSTKDKIKNNAKPKKKRNINKTKFKWTLPLTLLTAFLAILIIVTIVLSLPSKMDKLLERWSSAELTEETNIREISEKDLLKLLDKEDSGTVFVFYGTPDSEESVNKMKIIESTSTLFDLEITIYWLDATEINSVSEDDRNTTDFKRDIDEREKALQDVDLLKIPSFWYFLDGTLQKDTADAEDTAFDTIVNNAFGEYASSLK